MNHKKILLAFSGAYLVLAFFILPHYQFFIQDDAVSYINIAKKYASGHFREAVNGYWSPLYALLMVPLLLLSVSPLLAAKLVPIIAGLGALVGMSMFADKFAFERKVKVAVLAAAIPLLLFFAFTELSPDLITVCLLLFYFLFVFDEQYAKRPFFGIYAGLLGGLLYLSKSYCFYFFIVHFVFFSISQYYAAEKKSQKGIVANFALGMLMFVLISVSWITVISMKYGHVTTGTVASINLGTIVAPDRPSPGYPMKYEGLLSPPDQFSGSAWDDPSYLPAPKWSPFKSSYDLLYFTKHTFFNFLGTYEILASPSPIFPFLMILSLLLILSKLVYSSHEAFFRSTKGLLCNRDLVVWLIISMVIYLGGYVLVLVQPRYLWIIFLVLLLIGGVWLQKLFSLRHFEERAKVVILVCLWILIVTIPSVKLEFGAGQGRDVYDLAVTLQNLGVSGNIASNPQPGTMQNYQKTEILSYFIDAKYFGEPLSRESKALTQELKQHHIDYYLVWSGNQSTTLPQGDFIEIEKESHPELKIFQLIKK
jgi:hypothetical protein